MPRILTIITPDVPDITLFVGSALGRGLHFTPRSDATGLAMSLFDDVDPTHPALEVVRPTFVADVREVTRFHRVDIPTDWELLVLTQCTVPHGDDFEAYMSVAQDVAIMSNGIASVQGRALPRPTTWPWSRGQDGRWVPAPQN